MKKILGFAAMAAFLFASCAKELNDTGNGEGNGPAAFQISLQTSKGTLVTYADIASTEEWNFGDVTMFIYEAKADKSGALLNPNTTDFTVDDTTPGRVVLTASEAWLTANKGTAINAYFVGNNDAANLFDNLVQASGLATEGLFIEQLTEAQKLDAGYAELLKTPLLFSASATAIVPSATKVTVPVTLKRREARFDIVNPVPADFVISKVVVKNANLQGFIFAAAESTPTYTKGNLKEINTTLTYDTENLAASVFYLYPTQLGAGNTEISIIASMNSGPLTAYDVNSTAQIEANKRYKLIFDKAQLIFNCVAADYDEGEELLVGASTAGITSFSAGTGTGSLTNNSYELVAGENATLSVTLGASAATGFDVTVSGATGIVSQTAIATTQNIGALTYGAAYFPVTYNIATTYASSTPGTEVVITFTEKGNAKNSASILLYDGDTRTVQAASNSYMIAPGSDVIAIPVSRAYEHWNSALANDAVFDAEFVWTDLSAGMSEDGAVADVYIKKSGTNAILYVKPGTAEGNAVVAVAVNGEIKWSWHIWTTNYDPETTNYSYASSGTKSATQPDAGTTHTFMDRNLGAMNSTPGNVMSQGLLYQFGRKDPIIGNNSWEYRVETQIYDKNGTAFNITKISSLATSSGGNPNNLDYTIENPTVLIYAAKDYDQIHGDWYTTVNDRTAQNGELWATIDGAFNAHKALYDPCPAGWRVPAHGAHNGFSADAGHNRALPWSATAYGRFGTLANPLPTDGEDNTTNSNATVAGALATAGYFPASGMRSSVSGNLGNHTLGTTTAGFQGFYWTSTANSTSGRAYGFNISNTAVNVNGANNRGGGQSVRCVKE